MLSFDFDSSSTHRLDLPRTLAHFHLILYIFSLLRVKVKFKLRACEGIEGKIVSGDVRFHASDPANTRVTPTHSGVQRVRFDVFRNLFIFIFFILIFFYIFFSLSLLMNRTIELYCLIWHLKHFNDCQFFITSYWIWVSNITIAL